MKDSTDSHSPSLTEMVFETLWLSQGCTHSSGRLPASIQFSLVSLTLRSSSTASTSRLVSESGLACTQKVSTTSVPLGFQTDFSTALGFCARKKSTSSSSSFACARRK